MKQLAIILMLCIGYLTACQSSQPSPVDAYPFQLQPEGDWGLMGKNGEVCVPAGTYPQPPTAVVNKLYAVPDSAGFWQLYHIDQPHRPLSHRRFARIGYFFSEVAPAQERLDGPILLIDRQGNPCFSADTNSPYPLAYLHNFSEGRALAVTSQGKYGYLDTQGRWVIPPLYHRAYDFHQGRALVGTENRQGQMGYQFIDRDGKPVMTIEQNGIWLDQGFSNQRLLVKRLDTQQFSYLNLDGKDDLFLPQEITDASAFCFDRAAVQTAQGWGVMSLKGDFILPPHFQQIYLANRDEIWARQADKWARFNNLGEAQTAFVFDTPHDYLAQMWKVTQVRVDSAAIQLKPQRFWRETIETMAPNHKPVIKEAVAQANSTPTVTHTASTASTASVSRTKNPINAKPVTHLTDQDWRQVGQQNPFYAEAQKVLSGKLKEDDAKRRRLILNYVEHFRTAYTSKDIDFLEQVFSEKALIIVGKVIRSAQQPEGSFLTPHQVVYQVKSKRQYLDRLKQVFQGNREIKLAFSDFHIMRHPTHPNIYGVSLRQGYQSDLYSDDGYLFLLWDFNDETAPKIHVRTWQPTMINEHTPLPEEAIINIRHFNLK